MEIIEAFAVKNKCYQAGAALVPRGLMLHSIGTPQPNAAVLARYYNQYQPGGQSVCVHGFIQRDGTYYQTLPYTMRAWHCGGSANQTHIGIEMTEPASIAYTGGASWRDLNPAATEAHVRGTYAAAVELFAQLCVQYALDPLADGVIISHAEGAARGVASHHADPTHLWRAFGLTMDGFRQDVAAAMAEKNTVEEDDDMVRYSRIEDVPDWAQDTVRALMDAGALKGDEHGCIDLSLDMVRGMVIGQRYAAACNPRYYSIDDVPAWAREETQRLIDRDALQGDGKHELNVTYDALQAMIVCQRMIDAADGK
ncbi:peptidoglycan recognition protein family protein [Leyella stercorea]|uniref:peptidoglycan recognition protein family protein n=1 Tax=Leyella stercorea TaxID=363265 RepID=UPI00242F8D8C|nr:peptidoglycan recognition family protein [Leyella stercorea]